MNSKTMENLRNKIDARLTRNKKEYLKWISKPKDMSQKIFDIAIRRSIEL